MGKSPRISHNLPPMMETANIVNIMNVDFSSPSYPYMPSSLFGQKTSMFLQLNSNFECQAREQELPSQRLPKAAASFLHKRFSKSECSSDILKRASPSLDNKMVRRGMVRVIEQKLSKALQSEDCLVPKESLAQALEQHLYKTAPNFGAYADPKTLDSRLRLVTSALLRRRRKKLEQASRTDILRETLGDERYQKAMKLVSEVKILRLQRLARDCPQCKDGACNLVPGAGSGSLPFQAQDTVPLPVRSLFFNTPLVQIFEHASAERIPQLDWDNLIKEARDNIRRYKEWDREVNLRSPGHGYSSDSDHSGTLAHPVGSVLA